MLHKARATLEKDVKVSRPYLFFVEKYWEKNYRASVNFSVKPGADRSGTFTVFKADESMPCGNHHDVWRVDMERRSCTCGQWIAWACPHAIAVIFSDEARDYAAKDSQKQLRKFKTAMVHEHLTTGYNTAIFKVLEQVFKNSGRVRMSDAKPREIKPGSGLYLTSMKVTLQNRGATQRIVSVGEGGKVRVNPRNKPKLTSSGDILTPGLQKAFASLVKNTGTRVGTEESQFSFYMCA